MVAGWNWIFEPGGHKSSGYIMLSGQWSPSQECEIGNEECFGAATVPTRTCSCILSARFIGKGCKLGHLFMPANYVANFQIISILRFV